MSGVFSFSPRAPGRARSSKTQIFMDEAVFGLGDEESGSAALLIWFRERL